jgi:hypothetical protein
MSRRIRHGLSPVRGCAMTRKRNADDRDDVQKNGETADQAHEPPTEGLDTPDLVAEEGVEAVATEDTPNSPTESDLESQGFTPDEVRRLVVISDRVARSPESQDAEAELRRLRFTRWLVERGVLDEWSA